MALYANSSRIRVCTGHGPRSLSTGNPGSLALQRFSTSTTAGVPGGRPLHRDSPGPKPASKKAQTFASLSLTRAVDPDSSPYACLRPGHQLHCGPRHVSRSCTKADGPRGGAYARSASLFLPKPGSKTQDLDCLEPLAATIIAMSKTRLPDSPSGGSVHHISGHLETDSGRSPPQMPSAPPSQLHSGKPAPVVFTNLDCSSRPSVSVRLPSPTARARRAVSPSSSPPMRIRSSPSRHTLDVHLPPMIQPEMVTISAKRGDKLEIVADAWHLEADCHYEWQIGFAPHDIDMTSVQAKFDPDGLLTIDVRRRPLDYRH